ncbi:hypothetical protein WGT02_40010 (plasmid) [Rhizobium sp. T1470]|uniref:hypothetical protein n=1 Tax=unclassified Rhizobium TaxID=2613769 RepID=UPI001CD35201|nr:hypothetical protein [Rhizobium sp. T1473]MCA0807455.1 hypothetical protein [Rhizobium sp. T1473]
MSVLSSNFVMSKLFRQANGKADPKLAHPTSAKFDYDLWKKSFAEGSEMTSRDATLVKAALLIGTSVSVLRQCTERLFEGLTPRQAITFAVADANRAWAIIRQKNLQAMRKTASANTTAYSSTLGRSKLDVGPHVTSASADILNMTSVDCLPHWFAGATSATPTDDGTTFDYSEAGWKAQYLYSLEHVFKEIWLQILWEPWDIVKTEVDWEVKPHVPDDRGLWSAWGWRDESLAFQQAMVRRNIGVSSRHPSTGQIVKTAIGLTVDGGDIKIVVGAPNNEHMDKYDDAMVTLDSCYLGSFADEPISSAQSGLTLRRLELAARVIQDLVGLMLPDDGDVEYQSEADLDRISCAIRRSEIVDLLASAFGVGHDIATKYLEHFLSAPFANMTAVFRNSLWHRPIVCVDDDPILNIVAGAMMWGSPVRRFERWLQEANKSKDGDDLTKTPLGMKYESATRTKLQDALARNIVLAPVSSPMTSIPKGKAKEEVDGLVRIGSTVLVLEIKCFLSPSEPIDRHNYLVKLEKATAQVSRKAQWLQDNPEELAHWLGSLPSDTKLRFVPLVVVNQSAGAGFRSGDAVVVDAHFLSLFLSDGTYRAGAARDFTTSNRFGFLDFEMYASVEEAECQLPQLFENHPGLAPYLSAVAWDEAVVPLHNHINMRMRFPVMNTGAIENHYPAAEDFLPR